MPTMVGSGLIAGFPAQEVKEKRLARRGRINSLNQPLERTW
jgi:hypothetical protein